MHDPNLKLKIYIKNIVVEGTVSQIFNRDPGSFFFIKYRKKYSIKKKKKLPVFCHQTKTKT